MRLISRGSSLMGCRSHCTNLLCWAYICGKASFISLRMSCGSNLRRRRFSCQQYLPEKGIPAKTTTWSGSQARVMRGCSPSRTSRSLLLTSISYLHPRLTRGVLSTISISWISLDLTLTSHRHALRSNEGREPSARRTMPVHAGIERAFAAGNTGRVRAARLV